MTDFKYVRIQGSEYAANTMHPKGVFSVFWKLLEERIMDEEDEELFKALDAFIADSLPFPPQCNGRERVICFFKTENSTEMMKLIKPMLFLLDKYHVPYFVVYTNDPGEIIYEDKYQVAVKVRDIVIDYDVKPYEFIEEVTKGDKNGDNS